MNIISYGSKGAKFLSRLWDLFLLNFLWIAGSLPIITIGVSTIAAYSIALKIVADDEIPVFHTFLQAYKDNFKQGLIVSVLFFAFTASAVLDFILFEAVESNPIGFSILGFVTAAVVLMHSIYIFPLISRYRNKLHRHLVNSRRIFLRFFVKTLICILLVAAEIWLFFFNGHMLMFVGFFVAPALVFCTVGAFANKIFIKLEKEREENPEMYENQDP